MMRFSTLRHRLPAVGLCLALSATVLAPLPAAAAEAREYRIEAGRLDSALSRYASEAGLTLVIDGRLTDGKATAGLDGHYRARAGLSALLAGSGLEAVRQPNGSYRLRPLPTAEKGEHRLPEVSVTSASASGRAVDVTNAPASISVISREDLEGKSYRDITQALQDVPGVYVDDGPSGKGGTEEISIRGMDSKYTLILVDGRPQGSGQSYYNGFGSGAEYGWLPPISAIERIEVIRGPMSSLYGSDALGGVINVITKATPDQWGGSVTLERTQQESHESGDYQQQRYYLSGPLIEDTLGFTVNGSRYQRDEDQIEAGYRDYDRDNTIAKLTWTPVDNQSLSLEAGYSTQETLGTAANSGSDSELYTVRRHQALNHDILWHGDIDTKSWVQREELENQTQNALYERVTANTSTAVPLGDHVLTLGGQYREQKTENPTRAIGEPDLERWDMALFGEDQWFVTDDLALTAGLRWVDDENYGSEAVPRAYAVYNFTPQFTLKGGVSAGYRTPDLKQGDSNWVEGGGGRSVDGGDIGNDDLKPEKSLTYELGALWEGYNGVQASVTVFHTDYDDKIEKPIICDRVSGPDTTCLYQGYDYEKLYRYTNVDEARIRGAEVTFSFPVGYSVRVDSNYTFTDSEQLSGDNKGNPLNDQPRHRANLGVNWRANDATRLWAKARFKGKAEQIAGRGGLTDEYPSYTLVDTGLIYALTEQVEVYGSVQNVLDKEVDDENFGRVLDGRRYSAGVTVNF
ncbi:TonB-dependent receptor [Alloalcanivorax marinus]|uniref:TonB-dependent receptor n=1 Tax=Alloalcanivorax marinus TaxID=1177169 RepID=UPI001933A05A|nr:TonB-dependent receptor [Alloalcanivorax marinus]MBL7249231.1 TonB-dependent receptor [Alloalcanivorax marinus]